MTQLKLELGRRHGKAIDRSPVDLSRADFGPVDGYNFRLPIKRRHVQGFDWRYGRPANAVTLGKPLFDSGLPWPPCDVRCGSCPDEYIKYENRSTD